MFSDVRRHSTAQLPHIHMAANGQNNDRSLARLGQSAPNIHAWRHHDHGPNPPFVLHGPAGWGACVCLCLCVCVRARARTRAIKTQ